MLVCPIYCEALTHASSTCEGLTSKQECRLRVMLPVPQTAARGAGSISPHQSPSPLHASNPKNHTTSHKKHTTCHNSKQCTAHPPCWPNKYHPNQHMPPSPL